MKRLPSRYTKAVALIGAAKLAPDYDYRTKWDAAALNGLDESLHEINYHSLATAFAEACR